MIIDHYRKGVLYTRRRNVTFNITVIRSPLSLMFSTDSITKFDDAIKAMKPTFDAVNDELTKLAAAYNPSAEVVWTPYPDFVLDEE